MPRHASFEGCLDVARGSIDTPGLENLCTKICESWHGPHSEFCGSDRNAGTDTRNDAATAKEREERKQSHILNLLVVDFEYKDLSAKHLSRLLAVSPLIPETFQSGIVITRANLSDPLLVSNITSETPIAFNKSVFPVGKVEFGPVRASYLHGINFAVGIFHSNFEKNLRFIDCYINGLVTIQASKLRRGLNLEGNTLATDQNLFVFIDRSEIDGGFVVRGNRFETINTKTPQFFVRESSIKPYFDIGSAEEYFGSAIYLKNNIIENLYIVGQFNAQGFTIYDNSIAQLEIHFPPSMPSKLSGGKLFVQSNRIENSLIARLAVDAGSHKIEDKSASLNIEDNSVGGAMEVQVATSGTNKTHAVFKRNKVAGPGYFIFEDDIGRKPATAGDISSIDMSYSRFGGPVFLESSLFATDYPELTDIEKKYSRQPDKASDSSVSCQPGTNGSDLEEGPRNEQGKTDGSVNINLASTTFGELNWGFPRSRTTNQCRFTWTGARVRYGDWKTTKTGPNFDQWHRIVPGALKPDNLVFAAKFLSDRGEFIMGRDFLENAKRLNYQPGEDAGVLDTVQWWILNSLLKLGGYGAKPERALIILVACVIVFSFVYRFYSSFYRTRDEIADRLSKNPRLCELIKQYILGKSIAEVGIESKIPGFIQFDRGLAPRRFSFLRYSADAMLPVISLHAYDRYAPNWAFFRFLAALQHVVGWILITVFLASASVL